MIVKRIVNLLAGVLVLLLINSCDGLIPVRGSGDLIYISVPVSDFTVVDADSQCRVNIIRGDKPSVLITVDDNLAEYLLADQEDGVFRLDLKYGNFQDITFRADIVLPELTGLSLDGVSTAAVREGFHSEALRISLEGVSDITWAEGTCRNLTLESDGTSRAHLFDLAVSEQADISLEGVSRAEVTVSGVLNARLDGVSTLRYGGSPRLGRVSVSGTSDMARR